MPSSRAPRRSRSADAATAAVVTAHMSKAFQRIHAVVVRIPRGRVMTYGDVAGAAGMPRAARVVGYAMRALNERLPWQRVIGRRNATTGHVTIKDPVGGAVQRQILEKEGVRFSGSGGIDLGAFGWGPASRRAGGGPSAGARREARSGRGAKNRGVDAAKPSKSSRSRR